MSLEGQTYVWCSGHLHKFIIFRSSLNSNFCFLGLSPVFLLLKGGSARLFEMLMVQDLDTKKASYELRNGHKIKIGANLDKSYSDPLGKGLESALDYMDSVILNNVGQE